MAHVCSKGTSTTALKIQIFYIFNVKRKTVLIAFFQLMLESYSKILWKSRTISIALRQNAFTNNKITTSRCLCCTWKIFQRSSWHLCFESSNRVNYNWKRPCLEYISSFRARQSTLPSFNTAESVILYTIQYLSWD